MAKVISIHEYGLKPGVDRGEFERSLAHARASGLLRLPGLEEHHFLRRIRGSRESRYAAVWIYASREAWEALWGPAEAPFGPSQYPERWRIWEEEVLAPFLDRDPDRIEFAAYEEL